MFQIGDVVVYGCKGVFRVDKIGYLETDRIEQKIQYYTLSPIFAGESVATPINPKIFMRKVMSRSDAENVILQIPHIKPHVLFGKNPRSLEASYQQALESHETGVLISIIKRAYMKRNYADKHGKNLALIDERYMKRAEKMLFQELAVALGETLEFTRERIEGLIMDSIL